jgi:membrane protease subunit HflC
MNKIVIAAVAAALIILGLNSVFIVDEGHSALLLQFGRVVRADVSPGLHAKIPLLQQVVAIDNRILSLDAQPQQYTTAEKTSVDVNFYVKWRIANATAYYGATGGDPLQAAQRLMPLVNDALRAQFGTHKLDDIIAGGTQQITEQSRAAADAAARMSLGMEVVDVRIKGIDLPAEVDAAVYKRMRAEQVQAANALRSAGLEAKTRIQADADRQVVVLKADAERDAEKVRGDGDAQAAAIYAQSYGQDPEFYNFYRSLIAYSTAFKNGKGVLILKPDSEFLRYFDDPSPKH